MSWEDWRYQTSSSHPYHVYHIWVYLTLWHRQTLSHLFLSSHGHSCHMEDSARASLFTPPVRILNTLLFPYTYPDYWTPTIVQPSVHTCMRHYLTYTSLLPCNNFVGFSEYPILLCLQSPENLLCILHSCEFAISTSWRNAIPLQCV